jgi:hypothetical protein
MDNFSRAEKIAAALYCIWFLAHLLSFSYAEENPENQAFWPFINTGNLMSTYGIAEFFIYTSVPLLIFLVYKMWYKKYPGKQAHVHRHRGGNGFFMAFLEEKIKAEELAQKINALSNLPVNYSLLDELKADREKISGRGVNAWLLRSEIKKKYKEFEQ